MLDSCPHPQMQRARGRASVAIGSGGRLRGLSQAGSAKVMMPRVHAQTPEAVFLNTAGGVTGGDQFTYEAQVESGAQLTVTTQTAERAYASTGAAAQVDIRLSAGQGAQLNWLPQETILFETSRLRRRTRIDLAEDARFLGVEITVLGRAAMGERITDLMLDDQRIVTRDGVPLWVDPLTLSPGDLAPVAGLASARALLTMIYVAPDAADIQLPDGLARSAWDGKLVLRGAFPDLWPLKQAVVPILKHLLRGPLPRVWPV